MGIYPKDPNSCAKVSAYTLTNPVCHTLTLNLIIGLNQRCAETEGTYLTIEVLNAVNLILYAGEMEGLQEVERHQPRDVSRVSFSLRKLGLKYQCRSSASDCRRRSGRLIVLYTSSALDNT